MEGAQDAEAVLAVLSAPLALELVVTRPGIGKYLLYASMLWIYVGSEAGGYLGLNRNVASALVFGSWLGLIFFIRKQWPDPVVVAQGQLCSSAHSISLNIDGQQTTFPLDSSLRVQVTYQGFKGEHLGGRLYASGVDNFIQINGGQPYRFAMPTPQSQETLRAELRRWYLLKVKVKEHRGDGPTFLLYRNISYEQIQACKQEFGVSLYN